MLDNLRINYLCFEQNWSNKIIFMEYDSLERCLDVEKGYKDSSPLSYINDNVQKKKVDSYVD